MVEILSRPEYHMHDKEFVCYGGYKKRLNALYYQN